MRARALSTTIAVLAVLALGAVPASAARKRSASVGGAAPTATAPIAASSSGGAAFGQVPTEVTTAGQRGKIVDGLAYAPEDAPLAVQEAIWAANTIVGKPYIYGGGHGSFVDDGYDCSGTVSFALHGGDLLDSPLDSSSFMRWGERGAGRWITVYTNPSHAFVVIAGLRLDTSAAGDPSGRSGPQWRPTLRDTDGFRARHPVGL